MEKIIVGIFVCMLLTVTVYPVIGLVDNNKIKTNNGTNNEDNCISFYRMNNFNGVLNEKSNAESEIITVENYGNGDVVDQQQTSNSGYGWGVVDTQWIAQSFKPRLEVLTRVQLYMFRIGLGSDIQITVSIRESLDGNDLTNVSVDASGLGSYPIWLEFDFPDINTTLGHTYYIVARAPEVDDDNATCWNFDMYNPYEDGDAWCAFSPDFNWFLLDGPEYPECDCCFMTYGLDGPPNAPTIKGTTEGKIGTEYNYAFETTDPEGHDVYYYINWGDDTNSGWLGPYSSGQNITVAHSWGERGKYVIEAMAKDSFDAESNWTTLEVTMPKNQNKNTQLGWLERFPLLQRLLDILGRIYIS